MRTVTERLLQHRGELAHQARLAGRWLFCAVAGLFLLSALFDVAMILFLPLFALGVATAALGLAIRGGILAWRMRGIPSIAVLTAAMVPAVVLIAAMAAWPVLWMGGYAQACGVLFLNQPRYERLMAGRPTTKQMRSEWAQVAGFGPTRIWAFGYGGWLSWDKDIVFDPLDRPEKRAMQSFGSAAASCRHLHSHFYDCLLDD